MTSEKQFYVYVHRKATDGSVFYVGKGSGRRAFSNKGRNIYWNRVFDKHGFTAHIVMRFGKEICAFSFERALIKFYGREKLCNYTNGGEGFSGGRHTDKSRKKISDALRCRVLSEISINKMSASATGRIHTKETKNKLSLIYKGISVDKKNYIITKVDGSSKVGCRSEIMDFTKIPSFSLSRIISGKRKTWRGWSIAEI